MSSASAFSLEDAESIHLSGEHWAVIVEHGRRKLRGDHLAGETRSAQAFGLVGGRLRGRAIDATQVFPLRHNARRDPVHGAAVDALVRDLAVPSATPLTNRGWLASPAEVLEAQASCDTCGSVLFGSYHTHKQAWEHDPRRDTPTRLDAALGEGQGLWMLIVSLVDPRRPALRAFWEGRRDAEAEIVVQGGR